MIRTPAIAQTSPDPEQTRLAVPHEVLAAIGNHTAHTVQTVSQGAVPIKDAALGNLS